MKTLLLLAGRSKRFWPLAEKTLFPVCGTNLLAVQIERLRRAGCTDIILVGGSHNLPQASALFPSLPTIEQEDLDLGMRGALLSALPHCDREPVLIVCGNDIVDASAYERLLTSSREKGVAGCLLAQRRERYFPGGYLRTKENRILSIVEKPGEGKEPGNLVNIVVHIHNDASLLLSALQTVHTKNDDGYEQALANLFPAYEYRVVVYEGVWTAVKFPWHLLAFKDLLLAGIRQPQIHPGAQIHTTAVVEGPVILEEGVRIFPHATVRGPCVIGKGTIVGNNTLIRDASIGDHCVIGFSSEVKSSVLGHHVWTHMSFVGDSVIGNNVSFGGGCMTGNLRLDEGEIFSAVHETPERTGLTKFGTVIGNDCRLGISVHINPGVKVGGGTFVTGHLLLTQDIPDHSYVTLKDGTLVVTENRIRPPESSAREGAHKKL
ncbi:MAG: NTP transferase domain-containing protein [Candidatus Peribacteraceae bacterium]|nr:NTP transferase domain-containing protein [Candidatus Peribacteraceae bacterium]